MASLIDPDAPPLLHMCCFGVPVEKVRLYGSSQSWLLKNSIHNSFFDDVTHPSNNTRVCHNGYPPCHQ